jgi:hypothetical protein
MNAPRTGVKRAGPGAGFLAVVVLAVAARAAFLDRQGLWADELFSLGMATGHSLEHPAEEADSGLGDFTEFPRAEGPAAYARFLAHDKPPAPLARVLRAVLLSDTNPPLYYILLHGWTWALGTGDAALHAFTALVSLGCLPAIWALARATGGRAAAFPAGLLFALSPVCVYYSTEGRMYGLVWLFGVAFLWHAFRAAGRGLSVARAGLLVLAGAGGLLTHYFFVFVWAAAIAWLLHEPGRAGRRGVAAFTLLTLAVVLPWYVRVPATLARWRVTGDWLSSRPDGYSPILAALHLPWSYVSLGAFGGGSLRGRALVYAAFLPAVALAGLVKLGRLAFTRRRLLLWFWAAAACAGPIVFDLLRGTYTTAVPRYAVAGMPAAFVLAGLALSRLGSRGRVLATGAVALLCLVGLVSFHASLSRAGEPFREVGALLARETTADDVVLVRSIPSGVCGIARYMQSAHGEAKGRAGFASWVGQLGRRRVPDDLYALAAGRRRIVLVDLHAVRSEAPERDWLEAHATRTGESRMRAASILYYRPRGSDVFLPPSARAAGRTPLRFEAARPHDGVPADAAALDRRSLDFGDAMLAEAPHGRSGGGRDEPREEGRVRGRLLDLVDEELRGLHRREVGERPAQQVALGQLLGWTEQLFAPGPGLEHVHGREDAAVGDGAVEDELHVPGALELLEDHLVHPAARVDERGGQDGEAAAAFAVAGGPEELPWELERPVVDAAAHGPAPGADLAVAGAAEAGEAVQEDDHVAARLDEPLGPLDGEPG